MAGLFDGLVKGLASLAPQDDPEIKKFNAQSELKEIADKETAIFAQLGRSVYSQGGPEMYPEAAVQLNALALERTQIQQRLEAAEAEKRAREEAAARARIQAEAEANARAAALTCPNCGNVNAEGFKFCSSCGTRLPESAPTPQKRFCSHCGAEVAEGMRFCSTCGTRQE